MNVKCIFQEAKKKKNPQVTLEREQSLIIYKGRGKRTMRE